MDEDDKDHASDLDIDEEVVEVLGEAGGAGAVAVVVEVEEPDQPAAVGRVRTQNKPSKLPPLEVPAPLAPA